MASGKLEHFETCREVAVPDESNREQESAVSDAAAKAKLPSGVGLAVGLAALAAVAAGIAIQQIYERRLSKPEMARLRFYRYLREKGHLDS